MNILRGLAHPQRIVACFLALLLFARFADTAQALTLANGGNQTGTLSVNTAVTNTFVATNGNAIVLRIGAADFRPRIDLYSPDGTLIGSAFGSTLTDHDASLTLAATNSGTFTVVVSSYYLAGNGPYSLSLATIPGSFIVPPDDEGGVLTNGTANTGTVTLGDLDMWSFDATNGDQLILRMGTTSFRPRIDLYGPNGMLIASGSGASSSDHDVSLAVQTTNSGSFTVVVQSYYLNGSGGYYLNLARMPAPFVISPGDEGGDLINGASTPGTLVVGDMDLWDFQANSGDRIALRVGTTGFRPQIDLYRPDGTLIGSNAGLLSTDHDAYLALQVTNTGTFTAIVHSSYANGAGTYTLNLGKVPGAFVVSPGDQGGDLVNGAATPGEILVGDLDLWSFTATTGDSIALRIGAPGFRPQLDLYGPNGQLVSSATADIFADRDAYLLTRATNSGIYTVVVHSYYYNGSGTYALYLAQTPKPFVVSVGDEGGALVNGATTQAAIDLGDLDQWNFSAKAGDSIALRMGAPDFRPQIDLYGPDGQMVGSGSGDDSIDLDAYLRVQATNSGTFTAVVHSYYYNGNGPYTLHLAQVPKAFVVSPGDQGGTLVNGTMNPGTIDLGDLDMWSFTANANDSIVLRLGTVGFRPKVNLYGPNGLLIGSGVGDLSTDLDAELDLRATNSGTFTAVVQSFYFNGTGTYNLNLARSRGKVFVSPGDEGGGMVNGRMYHGKNALGDLDVWSFYGTIGDSNVFRISTTDYTPWLRLYGPSGALVAQAFTVDETNRTNYISYVVPGSGTYTFVSSAYFLNQSGTYNLKQSRVPPDLVMPSPQHISELTNFNTTIWANDPDDPNKPLTFTPVSLPVGAIFNQTSPTNATITWPTDEATGPSTNVFVASVTDVVNGKAFIRTNSFTVIVDEINLAPRFTSVLTDQTIDELTPLAVSVSATDDDLPPNPLTFSLVSPPSGMTINPDTGAISWTPTEAQGPSTNLIKVVVTDDSPVAVNAKHLSATDTFTVVVREVNTPPQLGTLHDWQVNPGQTVSFVVPASDSDLPKNTLTYSLITLPSGATLNPTSGLFNWRPPLASASSTNLIQLMVQDNGVPSEATFGAFQVVVNPLAPVVLTPLGFTNGQFQLRVNGTPGPDYILMGRASSTNWTDLQTNTPASTPFDFFDPMASNSFWQMYRVRLGP